MEPNSIQHYKPIVHSSHNRCYRIPLLFFGHKLIFPHNNFVPKVMYLIPG